jgi:hypothetical protein
MQEGDELSWKTPQNPFINFVFLFLAKVKEKGGPKSSLIVFYDYPQSNQLSKMASALRQAQ